MPKISVIVPIYNAEQYLESCLESIVNQSLQDIEIICVNDGAKDSSPEIIRRYVQRDKRVKMVDKPNSGYGDSMNRGLEVATGEYIGIVESDDFIVTDMYEKLYALTEKGTVDVVKGNFFDCYDENNGKITRVENRERKDMPKVEQSFTVREYPQILWGHPSIWSGIYKRKFLQDNNIRFKAEKGGGWVDNPFFFDTLCCAKKIRWTDTPFYCYRKTNEASSSVGYDLRIPFERMYDNLNVLKNRKYHDEEILKFAYARALMYLCGAVSEKHYAYNEDYARPYIQKMLGEIIPDVILDDFNHWDQYTYFKYSSPITTLMPKTTKILIYNWVPFDNPGKVGGGVTIYCQNLIASLLRYRPDIQVYFLSSGWAYDISTTECYIRKIPNIFGDRCRSFEVVNSPVPAAQDMLFNNPEVAFESAELKKVIADFIKKNGPFSNIHFNNIEGLSLDVLSLKEEYPDTRFVYSMHNYVPICMTGFYFRRDLHCNCNPNHTAEDCGKCIKRDGSKRHRNEMIARAKANMQTAGRYDENKWALKFGFEKLDNMKTPDYMYQFVERATKMINQYMDVVLAVSDRVHVLAEQNGISPEKIRTSYIGTKIANYQIGHSTATENEYFKLAYLGSNLLYEEKGYPFLLNALNKMDVAYAKKIDLILTTTTRDKDEYIKEKLSKFHSVEIIHGYSHQDIPRILRGANLGVIPVLWEDNLPQISIEMVACGVPILCSNAGGASELCTSDKFKFESGNIEDFLNKLTYFVDHRDAVKEYWDYHKGLVTLKEHMDEMIDVFQIPDAKEATITVEDYAKLLAENEFLYRHFKGDGNSFAEREKQHLQEQLDEVLSSETYKVGKAVTYLPKKLRDILKLKK